MPASDRTSAADDKGAPRRWRVRLLGAVQADELTRGERLDRLPTRAEAALLARLALAPGQAHDREALVESLWPAVEPTVGRNRLRQTLAALKRRLEGPAGQRSAGLAVIVADRHGLRVRPGALQCDLLEFEDALDRGDATAARAADGGEFMPGHYDDWTLHQRRRVDSLRQRLQALALPPNRSTVAGQPTADATHWPHYLTRPIGADAARARLQAAVQRHRLVTVLGPGGAGKTRLAIETLRDWSRQEPAAFDRWIFVPLAACDDEASARAALAQALGLGLDAGAVDGPAWAPALQGQRCLMLLDNFEQLVPRARALLADALAALPQLHLLVTSRRPLALPGELHWRLPPLAIAATADDAAVALFLDRAAAVRPLPVADAATRDAVSRLVGALGGWPLAIELAATRSASFTPQQMLALLLDDHREAGTPSEGDAAVAAPHLDLLQRPLQAPGGEPGDDRHDSMARAIAWSWRLLEPPLKLLMSALAQVEGDADVALAAALTDTAPARAAQLLDDLVGHSLLHAVAAPSGARFALPQPVREYVRTQTMPAQALRLRGRLRQHLIAWAATPPARVPQRVAEELPTVLGALAQATSDGVPSDALRLALALRRYWDSDGQPARLLSALEQALAAVDKALDGTTGGTTGGTTEDTQGGGHDPGLRGDAHELLAYLQFGAGHAASARDHAQAAIQAAGTDAARLARALARRAWIELAVSRSGQRHWPQDLALRADLARALALAESAGDLEAQARVLQQLGACAIEIDADFVAGEALMARAQACWQRLGDTRKAQARLRNRMQCWIRLGRHEQALATLQQTEAAARAEGDWLGRIDSLLSIAQAHRAARRWRDALDADRDALHLAWQRWHRHALAYGLWTPALALAHLRRPAEAAQLMAFAAGFWQAQYGEPTEQDRRVLRRVQRLVRAQIGPADLAAQWARGEALTVAEAVGLVLAGPP